MVRHVIFSLQGVSAGYTNDPLFTDVDMFLHAGDCYTLVGRNGTGKSTLFHVIDGALEIESGKRFLLDPLTISRLYQDPVKPETGTALDFVLSKGKIKKHRAELLLHELNIAHNMPAHTMSGGQIRRCDLAAAFAQHPDVLLLDEPTNHLDLPTVEWLEKEIKKFRGAIVVISHDRRFLKNVSNGVLWLEDKKLRFLNKSFAHFENWQDTIYDEQQRKFQKIQQYIAQEERYALRGVTARRKRNQRRVERLQTLRMQRMQRKNSTTATLVANTAKTPSKLIFETKQISKKFDDIPICNDFSFRVLRGDTIGIIGGNGTGKSTLLKIFLKKIAVDSGSVRKAKHLKIAYFDQYRKQLNPKHTPWEVLGNGGNFVKMGDKDMHVVGYLKRFLFEYEDITAPIATLSGGQKNRLMLAKILAEKSDVMILDEPTNDLDMDTLDVLEEMLAEYKGTLIIVSHDRDFLGRLCACMLVMEGQGKILEIIGDWDDYMRIKAKNSNKKDKQIPHKSPPKNPLSTPAPLPPKNHKNRLSPKEQHALKTLPVEMEKLMNTIDKMENLLKNPDLYTQDPNTFTKVSTALAISQNTLDKLENQWLTLSEKADSTP